MRFTRMLVLGVVVVGMTAMSAATSPVGKTPGPKPLPPTWTYL